jgi:hypothetical protein
MKSFKTGWTGHPSEEKESHAILCPRLRCLPALALEVVPRE